MLPILLNARDDNIRLISFFRLLTMNSVWYGDGDGDGDGDGGDDGDGDGDGNGDGDVDTSIVGSISPGIPFWLFTESARDRPEPIRDKLPLNSPFCENLRRDIFLDIARLLRDGRR